MKIIRGNKTNVPEPLPDKGRYRRTGLYERFDVNELDNRTNVAKLVRSLTQELEQWVGGEPSVAAKLLIQRAVYLHIKLSNYENAKIGDPEHSEAAHYLPMVGVLRLTIQALQGLAQRKDVPESLHGYIKAKYHEIKGKVGGEEK
jgi:hypothetical protein